PALKGFGKIPTPQTLALAIDPRWTAGVEKKGRKTGVKTSRKGKDDDAKDEKKPDETKDEAKDAKKDEKKADSGVALVPLPAGEVRQLPLFSLGLEMPTTRPAPASGLAYQLADFDKRIQAPEMKKLMEHLVQGAVPPDSAQLLAWHYHGRLSWEEMGNTGLIALAQLQQAQHYGDVVEGRAAP
ncbi:MAG TPA: hypothetical protein PK867_13635, partial [Pirellulales bacterium]|nr:hypothetical protein [Pirellulales bacterium]